MRMEDSARTRGLPQRRERVRAGSILLVWVTLCIGCQLPGLAEPAAPATQPTCDSGTVYRHGPYSAGRCDTCHAPHEAIRVPGLIAPERELCFYCHQDLQKSFSKGVRHRVVREEPCTTCHDPHRSPNRAMLKQPEGELCLGCHPKIEAEAARRSVHRPVAEGRCTACHDPHNSPYPHLLKADLDSRFYAPYSASRFTLCFQCHSPDLVQEREGVATGFRDGRKSDHFFHVNDPAKGRSCWTCHEAHGSGQPHLIKRSVKFGQWALPIRFDETPLGGACLCGCHRRLEYRRK